VQNEFMTDDANVW